MQLLADCWCVLRKEMFRLRQVVLHRGSCDRNGARVFPDRRVKLPQCRSPSSEARVVEFIELELSALQRIKHHRVKRPQSVATVSTKRSLCDRTGRTTASPSAANHSTRAISASIDVRRRSELSAKRRKRRFPSWRKTYTKLAL